MTPYAPTRHMETDRSRAWPDCTYHFLPYPNDCTSVDLWNGASSIQRFELVQAPGNETYFLRMRCGRFVSYHGNCASNLVDAWPEAGTNQEFRFASPGYGSIFWWALEAVGRLKCQNRHLSFPTDCSKSYRPVLATAPSLFLLHAATAPAGAAHAVSWAGCLCSRFGTVTAPISRARTYKIKTDFGKGHFQAALFCR